jgi:organic radical activating enzyme
MEIITQIINTIQGEGVNSGIPMTLIRFGNCNLCCRFCDTKWSNNITEEIIKKRPKSIKGPEFPNIIAEDNKLQYLEHIKTFTNKTGRILFTGGEPLLNQKLIIEIIKFARPKHIEFETNGTIFPLEFQIYKSPIMFNISPKLDPKYYKEKLTSLKDVINILKPISNQFIKSDLNWMLNWKFVHCKSIEKNIKTFINELEIEKKHITIMPLTPNYENYDSRRRFLESYKIQCLGTLEYCLKHNYRFSPRLQVWMFNNKEEETF